MHLISAPRWHAVFVTCTVSQCLLACLALFGVFGFGVLGSTPLALQFHAAGVVTMRPDVMSWSLHDAPRCSATPPSQSSRCKSMLIHGTQHPDGMTLSLHCAPMSFCLFDLLHALRVSLSYALSLHFAPRWHVLLIGTAPRCPLALHCALPCCCLLLGTSLMCISSPRPDGMLCLSLAQCPNLCLLAFLVVGVFGFGV